MEIVADPLRAAQALYFAAMLEQPRRMADRLAELFAAGRLPVGPGRAAERLLAYGNAAPDGMSEAERRSVYARVLGMAGGAAGQTDNHAFNDLFPRFAVAVSSYARRAAGDDPGPPGEEVRRAARDLAANVSLHAGGIARGAAEQLQAQVRAALDILGEPAIQAGYSARDPAEVIEAVASLGLNRARNGGPATVRRHTMAEAGSVLLGWLAENAPRLSGALVLDTGGARSSAPLRRPTDADLVHAAESWLSAAGTSNRTADDDAADDGARTAASLAPGPITGQTGLPPFVGELIHGTFNALTEASIQQMQSYAELVHGAAGAIDAFGDGNVTDDDARAWLAAKWPDALVMDPAGPGEPPTRRLRVGAADGGAALGGISRELGLAPPVLDLTGDAEEQRLVTAARTRLDHGRQQLLATLVRMNLNRVS
jgi:hypothetical protein